jgi:L-aminopeptidase/D-esterase-like protein
MKIFLLLTVLFSLPLYAQIQQNASLQKQDFNFNFSDFKSSTAEYLEGPTGMTLFYFPKGAIGAIDIRGGAAAVHESSSLDELNNWGYLDALVLAGGSTYGLESASGVMAALHKLRGGSTQFDSIPSVPAAIVYDFAGRQNSLYPDKNLGLLAFEKLQTNKISVGQSGAGVNVSVGKYMERSKAEASGQGADFIQVGGVKIFVLTVLNAVGAIHDQKGNVVRGNLDKEKNIREPVVHSLMKKQAIPFKNKENTTITIVIINADIPRLDLKRIAVMAHTSMASTIQPFHTPWDGDTLFVVSTQSEKLPKTLSVSDLGVLASEGLRKATLRAANALSY